MSMTMGIKRLHLHTDSQLVTYKVSREYEANNDRMMAYQEFVRKLLERFEQVHVKMVLRNSNSQDDAPSTNYSLVASLHPMETFEENWMIPIIKCLKTSDLSEDKVQARQ